MTYPGVETVSYQTEKRSWLRSLHGTDITKSVVLDVSIFNAAQYPNGYIPSGTVLGVISASSNANVTVVGPYDDTASDGRQTAAGILFSSVKVPNLADLTKDPGGAMLVHCFVREAKLPFQSGQTGRGYIDANGKTDLKLIDFSA